jgi:hypothetical protein
MRLFVLWLLVPLSASFADQRTVNWTGPYTVCNQHGELLKHGAMDLGVKFSTANPELEQQFRQALSFWAEVLDMRWHEDASSSCSIQLVDGTPEILKRTIVARSQFTDWDNFQGWIAFNPNAQLTNVEMYLTAVHEIGHMLGLKHNPDARSVMYYLDLEGQEHAKPGTRPNSGFTNSGFGPQLTPSDVLLTMKAACLSSLLNSNLLI